MEGIVLDHDNRTGRGHETTTIACTPRHFSLLHLHRPQRSKTDQNFLIMDQTSSTMHVDYVGKLWRRWNISACRCHALCYIETLSIEAPSQQCYQDDRSHKPPDVLHYREGLQDKSDLLRQVDGLAARLAIRLGLLNLSVLPDQTPSQEQAPGYSNARHDGVDRERHGVLRRVLAVVEVRRPDLSD